jgi:hypothetical protein
MMSGRYLDQWTVGDRISHEIRRTVTDTDIDVEAARASEFGQIFVNGTFTFALMVGLSLGDTTLGTLVANLGYDKLVMPSPVFIGDTLHRAAGEPERGGRNELEGVVGPPDRGTGGRKGRGQEPLAVGCWLGGVVGSEDRRRSVVGRTHGPRAAFLLPDDSQ